MSWASYQRSFYDRMFPLARRASEQTGIPADVIFAQAALESNWGRSAPQNNYFGIKGTGGQQTTREFVNGAWVTIRDSFRGYSSIEESVNGYVAFINNPNSRRWTRARNATSNEEAARALASGGYATDPTYADKILRVIRNIPANLRDNTNHTQGANTAPSYTPPFTGANVLGSVSALAELAGYDFDAMNELARAGNAISGVGDTVGNVLEDAGEAIAEANPLTGFLDFFKTLFSQETAIRLIVVVIGLAALFVAFASFVSPKAINLAKEVI